MQNVEISIIVPIYKVPEKYLRKCIESIENQTFMNYEIILVDDGSPDCCGTICDEYAKANNRIRVLHKENGGLSSARNAGYKASIGKYIMFVDGDDWIENEMCEAMYHIAEKTKVDLVMCGMIKEYGHSSEKYTYYIQSDKVYNQEGCKWLQEQLLHFNANIAVAYCKLIRRNILSDNDILHDEILKQGAEGLEFNLRLFEVIKSAFFLKEYFYHYIYNDNSISASHNEDNHKYVVNCFAKIKIFIENSKNKDNLMKWFNNRLIYVIITTAISGYFSPLNNESFSEKKRKYQMYLQQPIIQEALHSTQEQDLSFARKIVVFCIKHHIYRGLDVMARYRKWQKDNR